MQYNIILSPKSTKLTLSPDTAREKTHIQSIVSNGKYNVSVEIVSDSITFTFDLNGESTNIDLYKERSGGKE